MLEFSLPPFICSFIFLAISLAFLLCNIYGELISSRPDNGCGPGVIITCYYNHSFHLWFHVRQSTLCCCLIYLYLFEQSDVTYGNLCEWRSAAVELLSGTLKKSHSSQPHSETSPQICCLFSFGLLGLFPTNQLLLLLPEMWSASLHAMSRQLV